MEAQLVLATLVQHATFELVGKPIEPELLLTQRPKGEIRVVRRR
jgi:cytochrome P450